jgi:tRNA-2-methylthio-N6-dimethylallyladenosine synthase
LDQISADQNCIRAVSEIMKVRSGRDRPVAFVRTYGCQQNVADGEKIKGILSELGFIFSEEPNDADFIIFNTCAVREHAEDRVYGNIGALKNIKRKKPSIIIAVCGCMMEQESAAERVKKTFPFVNIVFGTHVISRLPEMIYKCITDSERIFISGHDGEEIAEGVPVKRESRFKAWLSIMYGCDNYCSYCIVPYVRGHERSRESKNIISEFKGLIEQGYKEITLLGQNVNSYGKGLKEQTDFPDLLRMMDGVNGDYTLRFMTSNPKDASEELFRTIAESKHICHHIHLPVQAGNDRVLKVMNRKYSRESYLEIIRKARELIPDITFSSDIIVGFPGETYEEFKDTISLIEQVRYTALYTFIYSKRPGTIAANIDDPISHTEKTKWFSELLRVQNSIETEENKKYVGKNVRCLVEERNTRNGLLVGRTGNNQIVEFSGKDDLVGNFVNVHIIKPDSVVFSGELIK